MFELRLLGQVDLRDAEGRSRRSLLSQTKRFAFLAYLGASSELVTRDALIALFWPDSSEERARRALNQTVYHIRRSLADNVIATRGELELGLNRSLVRCDVVAFEEAVRDNALRAASLYTGDLLAGFHLADCQPFDDWLSRRRTQLRDRAAYASLEAAGMSADRGEPLDATRWARRSAELAPYDEALHRVALGVMVRSGDHGGAAGLHDALVERLRVDLEVEPSEDTLRQKDAFSAGANEATRQATDTGTRGRAEQQPEGPAPSRDGSVAPYGRPRRRFLALVLGTAALSLGVPLLWVSASGRQPAPPTIAVLPFRPLDEGAAALAPGITIAVRDRIATIAGMEVTGSASSQAPELTMMPGPTAAAALGADYVLKASVEAPVGSGAVHVQPALFAANGAHLQFWRGTLSVEASDLTQVERSLAEDIADALDLTIAAAARADLTRPSSHPDAYEAYLRVLSLEDDQARETRLLDIVALDSTFALAHAELAQVYFTRWAGDHVRSPENATAWREAAIKASRFGPRLYRGPGHLALYHRSVTLDLDSALHYLERTVELAPDDADVRHFYSSVLSSVGRLDEALVEARRASALDPLNPGGIARVSRILFRQGRMAEAWNRNLEATALLGGGAPGEGWIMADAAHLLAGMGLADSARAVTGSVPSVALRARTVEAQFWYLQAWLVPDSLANRLCRNPRSVLSSVAVRQVGCSLAWARAGQVEISRALADSAVLTLDASVNDHPSDGLIRMRRAYAHFLAGDMTAALADADAALALLDSHWDYGPGWTTGLAYARLSALAGEAQRSVRQLTRMLDFGSITPEWIDADPAFDRIRRSPELLHALRGVQR